ncbi:MAG TPA: O-antigen ligase family protein [Solirubrobacteraceae bacterium]|nr:O-antigen ligase family protein [Solirubrobacteraceae bacterium]
MLGFAFASGGFLPGPVGLGATALAGLLVLRITLARRPWGALSAGYVAGAVALGLLTVWTLLSGTWSGATARAVIEHDRVLLYLLAFVVVGAVGRSPERLRWALRAIAAAAFVVCLCGLVTRVAPDVWPIEPGDVGGRLSYPLGYWNALGLMAAIGIVTTFALTCDVREAPVVRVLAAAALPALGATLLLTFSRGAIAVCVLGLVALVIVGRPRALLSGLLVGAPSVAVAVASAYGADLLTTPEATGAAATAQGHDVAEVVAICAVLAAAGRAVLLALDRRLQRLALPPALRRPAVGWAAAGVIAVAGVALVFALGAPAAVSRQYDRFVGGDEVALAHRDVRGRLGDTGNNGRIQQWQVALSAFERAPLRGEGAGTFALEWDRHRPEAYQVEDGHSLYLEVLAELGAVGLVLVLAAIVLVLAGFAARARGPDRVVGGALLAAGLTWAVHAGIDWDWEMPAVTAWLFAAGGLALAAPAGTEPPMRAPPVARIVVALGCLLVAVAPARVYLSEQPLRESARAFARGDCATAVDRALDSTEMLGMRPEPFILLGYCNVRLGQSGLAVRAMRNAVRRDPGNWEGHYGLALARAAAGEDPRPSLREARRLNPRAPLVAETTRLLGDDPDAWRSRVLRAQLPTD